MPKTSLNASCMVLVELAITCAHDYMAVTVKVTEIYEKMNFNNYSCTNNSHITISDNWLRICAAVIPIYKARARRNGYRMLIQFTYCEYHL